MAIVEWEGWDRETSLSLPNWRTNGGGGSVGADASGAFGYGRAFNAASSGNSFGRNTVFTPLTECWINLHFRYSTIPSSLGSFLRLRQGGNTQCGLGMDNAGNLCAIRGDSTLAGTIAKPPLPTAAWHFMQVRFLVDNAAGQMEVWINNTLHGTLTGLNIRSQATPDCDGWAVSTNVGGMEFDNLIIYTLAGNAPNARTPETRIYTDLPNANGAANAWTRSGGSANFDRVNEQPSNGDTSYNSAASAPLDDLYACASTIPAGALVYAVGAELVARKDDAGVNEIDALLRSGATIYASGATDALSTAYTRYRRIWDTDPAGGSWSVASANAAQVGIRRTA